MKHLGLFEGIGGFSLAARWAGWTTPVMVEWNKYCQAVLKKNFPDAIIFGDINEFDGRPYAGQIDVLTGGFPCQPYSHAGKRAGNDDARALWPQMLRVIREVGPRWVVGENVAGILSMDGGRVLAGILADLENAGYSQEIYSIPAIGVGAPHERERIWIVAHRDDFQFDGGGRTRGRRDEFTDQNRVTSDTNLQRCAEQFPSAKPGFAGFCSGGINSDTIANTGYRNGKDGRYGQGQDGKRKANEHGNADHGYAWSEHWLPAATRLCRVDDGVSAWVDGTGYISRKAKKRKTTGKGHRLEALGNTIVPHLALQFFEAINEYEKQYGVPVKTEGVKRGEYHRPCF